MESKYQDKLADKERTIKLLSIAVVLSFVLAAFNAFGWMRSPSLMTINIPPDLSNGATLKPGQIGKSNVYTFSHYIWQQLNRWDTDGSVDYEQKIHQLRHYMTAGCYQDRLDDYGVKKKLNELTQRSRRVSEIPGRGFSNERVVVNAANSDWTVYLDLHIQETMIGETIKDRFVSYPINVIKHDADPEKNPFGLAINCLASVPIVIEVET